MRALSVFFGSGTVDRYPNIRYCILDFGFGWLSFRARAWTIGDLHVLALPEILCALTQRIHDQWTFLASLVIHDGEKMAPMLTELLGGVLMYSSDYPHAESRFPESTNKVVGVEFARRQTHAKKCCGTMR